MSKSLRTYPLSILQISNERMAIAPNESSSFEQCLSIESSEKNLTGLSQMFADSDDDDDDESDEVQDYHVILSAMDKFTLEIPTVKGDSLKFSLIQSQSAFGEASGNDQTGNVLWGASFHLSTFLASLASYSNSTVGDDLKLSIKNKSILELGCGTALNSLVAARMGADFVIASDYEEKTLSHARYHVQHNNEEERVCVQKLDWNDIRERTQTAEEEENQELDSVSGVFSSWINANTNDMRKDWRDRLLDRVGFQVIIASDVIYGVTMVLPLVAAIDAFLEKNTQNGIVMIATRDGRRGIQEFRQAMKIRGHFEEFHSCHFVQNKINDIGEIGESENVPACFKGDASIARWTADHSIYFYRRSSNE